MHYAQHLTITSVLKSYNLYFQHDIYAMQLLWNGLDTYEKWWTYAASAQRKTCVYVVYQPILSQLYYCNRNSVLQWPKNKLNLLKLKA